MNCVLAPIIIEDAAAGARLEQFVIWRDRHVRLEDLVFMHVSICPATLKGAMFKYHQSVSCSNLDAAMGNPREDNIINVRIKVAFTIRSHMKKKKTLVKMMLR